MEKPRCIALIESDDLIRQLTSRWLEGLGHEVHGATVQTLGAVQSIDLIIADIAHPRKASTLVRLLRAAHDAPILLVSARFHRMQGSSAELAAQLRVAAVLAKPYNEDELHEAVVAALHQPDNRPP